MKTGFLTFHHYEAKGNALAKQVEKKEKKEKKKRKGHVNQGIIDILE